MSRMAEKKSGKKLHFVFFGLCSLVALAVCAAVLVATVRSVESSEAGTAEYDTQSKTELTNDTQVLLDYLKNLTVKTDGNKFIKADKFKEVSVDDSTITVYDAQGNESAADKKLLIYAKNKIISSVDGYYPEDSFGVFGTVTENIPIINLSPSSISQSSFSQGQTDENGNPLYSTDSGEIIDNDCYFITLHSEDFENSDIYKLFSLDLKQEISERFICDTAAVCETQNCKAVPINTTIYAKVNRLTDIIEYIHLEKSYRISADVTFINELAVFGNKSISFEYKVTQKFEYAYAGISFAESTVTVEPDSEIALSVNAVIENDSEYTVTFASSDPNVATVDEMGYVKGISASDKPVTVSVSLSYLGETFTDECTVYVGTQTES